jgi:hypothetical protein
LLVVVLLAHDSVCTHREPMEQELFYVIFLGVILKYTRQR